MTVETPSFDELRRRHIQKVSGGSHRNTLDILFHFLDVLQEPRRQTHILYLIGINHYQMQRYLKVLTDSGMVVRTADNMLTLTPAGMTLRNALMPIYSKL
jgi:predicted transcriptional regulator